MPAITEITITIETADHLLEDVTATVRTDEETYEREPYSWGQRRGFETVCNSARIVSVQLGDLILTREQLVQWVGEREVARQEDLARETINTMLGEAA